MSYSHKNNEQELSKAQRDIDFQFRGLKDMTMDSDGHMNYPQAPMYSSKVAEVEVGLRDDGVLVFRKVK